MVSASNNIQPGGRPNRILWARGIIAKLGVDAMMQEFADDIRSAALQQGPGPRIWDNQGLGVVVVRREAELFDKIFTLSYPQSPPFRWEGVTTTKMCEAVLMRKNCRFLYLFGKFVDNKMSSLERTRRVVDANNEEEADDFIEELAEMPNGVIEDADEMAERVASGAIAQFLPELVDQPGAAMSDD